MRPSDLMGGCVTAEAEDFAGAARDTIHLYAILSMRLFSDPLVYQNRT